MVCEFIGNPNKEDYYEDDVEEEIDNVAGHFIYIDPDEMGIEIEISDEDDEDDGDFVSYSSAEEFSSDDDFIFDDESLTEEVQELITEEVNFEPAPPVTYHKGDTDSEYTSSEDCLQSNDNTESSENPSGS